jgi:serine phosphatase RsbU (regulator of sigma subunit)
MLFNVETNPEEQRVSLHYFKEAYKLIKDLPGNFEQKAEYAGWISNSYNATREFDDAIFWRRKAITHAQQNIDDFILGDCYRYLSNTYARMNVLDSSLIYGQKALDSFFKHKIPSRVNVMTTSMAAIYLKTGQTEKARKLLEAILNDPDYNRDPYFYDLTLKAAAQLYKKNGDLARANRLYEIYITYADSMETVKDQRKITELNLKSQIETAELKYEFEQDKKEEEFLKETQKATIIRNALIAGSLLFLLLILVLFRSNHSKKKANVLLHHQKGEIEYQKKEIQDSINYARNIQLASLPNEASIKQTFTDHFILYKPKDVISGDFYWFHKCDDPLASHPLFIAAADCTGHGVPGAFMSMLGADCLDSIIMEKRTLDVGEALSGVNRKIKSTLSQSDQQGAIRDGMDIALCAFNKAFTEVNYAGAHRPLYLVRQKELTEYKATKQSIGGFTELDQEFKTHSIPLQQGDMIYLASDGYADQFGGDKGKKFTTARFKELLISLSTINCEEQKKVLDHTIEHWKGKTEQLDDIMIIGIRV